MHIDSHELHKQVETAIEEAERQTSAEIRVHLDERCSEDPLDRASYIFEKLGMQETAERNGVLIYVAFKDRKLAIIGDVGIHIHLPPNTWDHIKNGMTAAFVKGNYARGLSDAVAEIGEHLKHFFPVKHDDQNELSNRVSTFNYSSK
ncbi:MAG: TPM domain-containing protein [Flavobacteriales bacterium]